MSGERAGTTQHWPGKSGLSDLSRAQRRDHRELAQQQVHAAQVVFSRNLHALKSERRLFGFQCNSAWTAADCRRPVVRRVIHRLIRRRMTLMLR